MTQLYLPPELPCPYLIQMSVSAIGEDGLIYMRTQDAGEHEKTSSYLKVLKCTHLLQYC